MLHDRAITYLCIAFLLAPGCRSHADSVTDSFMRSYNAARESAIQQQQQSMYQVYLVAEMARMRAEQEAIQRQQELQSELLRLEQQRQRQAQEQADAERRRIEAEQLRQQMVANRAEMESKLFDATWRKAVGDNAAQQNLTRYNELSMQLGMPAMDRLPQLTDPALSQEELVAKVTPAVVLVRHRDSAGNWSTGTGFLISCTGDLLTCAHVITSNAKLKPKTQAVADKTWVRVAGSAGVEAEVVFVNDRWDVALLRIAGCNSYYLKVEEGNPAQGAAVFAFGYPTGDAIGTECVVTAGIVSALRLGDSVFQLDAAINPGNSGGPVVNKQGNIVGIAWAKLRDYEGTSFAISASTIQSILAGNPP